VEFEIGKDNYERLLANVQIALRHIKKRIRLEGAVFAFVTLLVATAVWRRRPRMTSAKRRLSAPDGLETPFRARRFLPLQILDSQSVGAADIRLQHGGP